MLTKTTTASPATTDPPATGSPFRVSERARRLKPSAIREILKMTEAPDVISFAGGLPAPELFPVEDFAAACRDVLSAGAEGQAAMQYGVTEGFGPLRQWVCDHLAQAVGLRCTPGQVLITNGSQQGLDLIAKVLLDPGDVVLVENPAYVGALKAFDAYEARVVGIPADEQGVRTDELRRYLRTGAARPKLLYLIPSFQNPTGVSTSVERLREVAQIAAEYDLPVLEDDPYGRLRYGGAAPPALASLPAAAGRVIYLGTTTKIMAPGMRVAWLVVPDHDLYEKLIPAKQAADLHTSTFTQRVVWRYASRPGALDAHLNVLLSAYRRRRDAMLDALARHLPEGCTWTKPEGGLFLWVTLPPRLDAVELLQTAMARKVAFVPGQPFWVGEDVPRNTLRLNFSNASEERIEEGVKRLGEVVKAAMRA
jgi:2-aminoadipate transaminase